MASQARGDGTIGRLLDAQRRQRFVGRLPELELYRAAIASGEPDLAVLYLHGPGGIGKTSLLDVFARLAEELDVTVVRLDARELVASPSSVLAAVGATVDVPDAGPIGEGDAPLTLLVDAYERFDAIDGFLRDHLVPRLPTGTVTVLAGRVPPGPGWRADAAWRDLLRVVSLRNLQPDDSRAYLDACGVAEDVQDELIALTHGHPLGLSLCADVVARGGAPGTTSLRQDLVGDLVSRFLDVVPDEHQRTALTACAQARVTTEELVREVVADSAEVAGSLFAWLSDLSFIEVGPDGLAPHDLARDVLDADLRWRDAAAYTRVFRRVADHIQGRLRHLRGRAQLRAISDLKFLFRHIPGVLSPIDWDAWGQHRPEPAAPTDRDAILDLIGRAEGDDARRIAARWWDAQPDGFSVLRDEADHVRGVVCLLDLTAADEDDRLADPGATAVWRHAQGDRPPRPGEAVTQTRFVVDRDAYQGPSPTLNAVPLVTLQRQLAMRNLAWDYLTMHDPDAWNGFFALADLARVPEADFQLGGRRFGVFAHDYRERPVDALIELWIERSLAQDPALQTGPEDAVHVLSQAEFTDAVRQALRDLSRLDLLGRNPLLGTRLLGDTAGGETPDAELLRSTVGAAIDSLRDHPRDDKLLRAVERTYVEAAPTQEAAAARLGLPFSTYRRHLAQGVERVVAWLWDREVYGPSGHGGEHG
jgi:hypothetical protein